MKVTELTMYQACLLHSRADRILRGVVSSHLEGFRITRMEWLLLSAIVESKSMKLSMTELAKILNVSLPQVTALVTGLLKDGLVEQHEATHDRRSRFVSATAKGKELITQIEVSMRNTLREWLADIPRPQLAMYMLTVQQLADQKTTN